jgi:hypothetical protein
MNQLTKQVSDWHKHLPNEWSPTEWACHLRDVELEINQPRVKKLLSETNPFIAAVDSDVWAEARAYTLQDGPAALASFNAARRDTLAMLENLTDDDWQRPARHGVFGPTTLQELMSFAFEHDRTHVRQMRELVEIKD